MGDDWSDITPGMLYGSVVERLETEANILVNCGEYESAASMCDTLAMIRKVKEGLQSERGSGDAGADR